MWWICRRGLVAPARHVNYGIRRKQSWRTNATAALAEIPKEIEFDLADTVIHHRNVYARALSEGLSVVESDNPKAKAEIQLLTQEITNL